MVLLTLEMCSCGSENRFVPTERMPSPDAVRFASVDAVKSHKDPKGSWFGPKLLEVYLRGNTEAGEDVPEIFCGDAPHIPTREEITVFFVYKKGTAESSSCRLIVAVAKGEAIWNTETGK